MASARPVLSVAEGGPAETVVDGVTGFVAPRDVVAFGARIRELLADPERADAVAAQARTVVQTQWTWAQSVASLEHVLRRAAAAGRATARPSGPSGTAAGEGAERRGREVE